MINFGFQHTVGVADTQNHDLTVKLGTVDSPSSHRHKVAVGQSLVASCISKGTDPVAEVTMRLNGNDVRDMRGGKVSERMCHDRRQGQVHEAMCITGYLDTVLEQDFDDQGRLMVRITSITWYLTSKISQQLFNHY